MEPIGQKAILPATDEVISAGEMGVVAGEAGRENIFDETLDEIIAEDSLGEIIAEDSLDENLLEELLVEDNLAASLSSVLLSQSPIDPKILGDTFESGADSELPLTMMDDNLWNENSKTIQSMVLTKATPIEQELIEVIDPRIATSASFRQELSGKGVAETGLQILSENSEADTETLLNKFLHLPVATEEGTEFSAFDMQDSPKNKSSQSVQQTGKTEISRSELHTILQNNTNLAAVLEESELQNNSKPENKDLLLGQKQLAENSEALALETKNSRDLQQKSLEMGNSEDSTKKAPLASLQQFKTLVPKENKISSNVSAPADAVHSQEFSAVTDAGNTERNLNSTSDSIISTGFNINSEVVGTSITKGSEAASSTAETFRSNDLPFNLAQVVSRVRILRGNGIEEMTLRLHPEELGQITLRVRQAGGDLMIDMRVDNPLAKQMVESGFDSLRSRFLDQDFAYQDLALNVDLNEGDSSYGRDQNQAEFEDELSSSQRAKKEELSTLEETPRINHRTDSGLNLYV
ncbi:MAG: flagellar hook-length control protein FliK [SAR324 cluster bacterium]|nr:flagellar hook-length control protein FliK [SAR324 cluster bacterium]